MSNQPWRNQPTKSERGNGKSHGLPGKEFKVSVGPEEWDTCPNCQDPRRLWVPAHLIKKITIPVIGDSTKLVSNPMVQVFVCLACGLPHETAPDTRAPSVREAMDRELRLQEINSEQVPTEEETKTDSDLKEN